MHIQQNNTMQKKCLQKTQQKPFKNPEKPKNQNFKKWVFANPVYKSCFITYELFFRSINFF